MSTARRATLALTLAAVTAGAAPAAWRECDRRFAGAPDEYESALCYYEAAARGGDWDAARRRLEALQAGAPDNGWLLLTRAHLETMSRPAESERLYRAAVALFAARGHAVGEVTARFNLRTLLERKGRAGEAAREIERIAELRRASRDARLQAQALAFEALHAAGSNRDLGRAYRALRRAEAASGGSPRRLRQALLVGLGNVSFAMGRWEDALRFHRQAAELALAAGDHFSAAATLYNVANTRLRLLKELPRAGALAQVRDDAQRALEAARRADNRDLGVASERLLGEVWGGLPGGRAVARGHLERCLADARALGQSRELSHCLSTLGAHLAESEPVRADALIDEAVVVARESGSPVTLAHAWHQRLRVSWRTRPPERALLDSRAALEAIEALRRSQPEQASAAWLFSAWSPDYYWLSGRLLQAAEEGAPDALSQGFEVVERLRARALLDALQVAGDPAWATPEARARDRQARAALVRLQRRLLAPDLPAMEREVLEGQLERAEDDERDARRALAPEISAGPRPRLATLHDVRAALEPDEALLSFQVGLWTDALGEFGGGAWVLAVTRDGARAFRLPDRARLEPAAALFLGLVERRDGSEAPAAARLHAWLLADALSWLPAGVTRLTIVPDGALHRLPLGALAAAGGEALVSRYALSCVPSASLWLRWRRASRVPLAPAVLALADPGRTPAAGPGVMRAGRLGTPLLRLPHARREGRRAVRALGGSSRLLTGPAASERALKTTPLAPFGLVHFAAHALVDDEQPERSSIVLAPGADDEDGLLQWREIAELPLARRAVVLSACRSAGGAILHGEGVLGLARAFFEAGAHVVVGGLWPLRDDETAALLERVYAHLRRGRGVAQALRAAQDEARRAGAPAAAWAGVVALGDASAVTFAPSSTPFAPLAWSAAAAALVGAALALARRAA
jgi:CHAT domain-containing protein/tetratricopeptide (TPR) repeat protein